jgi:hypothetical protein
LDRQSAERRLLVLLSGRFCCALGLAVGPVEFLGVSSQLQEPDPLLDVVLASLPVPLDIGANLGPFLTPLGDAAAREGFLHLSIPATRSKTREALVQYIPGRAAGVGASALRSIGNARSPRRDDDGAVLGSGRRGADLRGSFTLDSEPGRNAEVSQDGGGRLADPLFRIAQTDPQRFQHLFRNRSDDRKRDDGDPPHAPLDITE